MTWENPWWWESSSRKKAELGLYQSQLNKSGFISQLKSMLSEFYQYGISRGQLEELLKQTDRPLLKHKLQDMLVMYQGFEEYSKRPVFHSRRDSGNLMHRSSKVRVYKKQPDLFRWIHRFYAGPVPDYRAPFKICKEGYGQHYH